MLKLVVPKSMLILSPSAPMVLAFAVSARRFFACCDARTQPLVKLFVDDSIASVGPFSHESAGGPKGRPFHIPFPVQHPLDGKVGVCFASQALFDVAAMKPKQRLQLAELLV